MSDQKTRTFEIIRDADKGRDVLVPCDNATFGLGLSQFIKTGSKVIGVGDVIVVGNTHETTDVDYGIYHVTNVTNILSPRSEAKIGVSRTIINTFITLTFLGALDTTDV